MDNKRLTPEERDQLAADLQKKLSRERIRRGRWFLVGLAFMAIALWGLRYASRMPPPDLPPVTLVCFDALIQDESASVEAQLFAPGHPEAALGNLEMQWEITSPGGTEKRTTKTERRGITLLPLGPRQPGISLAMKASFVDPLRTFRRDDGASAVWPAEGVIQVVGVDELVAGPVDWLSGSLETMPPAVVAGKLDRAKQTIYCAGSVDPIVYRGMRNWLRQQAAKTPAALPAGVLLRELPDAAAKRLAARRPDNTVTRPLLAPG